MSDELIIAIPPAGRYIVAVSGGVDSMVLLHALHERGQGLELVVAHFDHGVRADSLQDRRLVGDVAARYGLIFEYATAHLPADVSEAVARNARYAFLRQVQAKHGAQAILMAHHQDDVIETACINLLRGTGRKGLTSLRSGADTSRPLLGSSKQAIVHYSRQQGVVWHEDSTNANTAYLRNKLRLAVLPRLTPAQRKNLLGIIADQTALNLAIDTDIAVLADRCVDFEPSGALLPRYQLVMLPSVVAFELLQYICTRLSGHSLESPAIWRALEFAKAARPHKKHPINRQIVVGVKLGGRISITPTIVDNRLP